MQIAISSILERHCHIELCDRRIDQGKARVDEGKACIETVDARINGVEIGADLAVEL